MQALKSCRYSGVALTFILLLSCGLEGRKPHGQGSDQPVVEVPPAPPSLVDSPSQPDGDGDQGRSDDDLPPPSGLPAPRRLPRIAVAYDYAGVLSRDSQTAAVIRLVLQGGPLKASRRVLFSGSLLNLNNSSIRVPVEREVDVAEGGIVDFTVSGLDPETIYRLEKASLADASGGLVAPPNAVQISHQFHVATVGDSALSKARRRMVLRAVAESYDWDHGNYDGSKGYANGSWCDRFYTWAAQHDFKVANPYSAKSFFSRHGSLGNSGRVPGLAARGSVMGDFVRYEGSSQGTHTFMILAYDQATRMVWTVEGNFNSSVERLTRRLGSGWWHGQLVDSQVR